MLLTCSLPSQQSESCGHEIQRADEQVEQAQDDCDLGADDCDLLSAGHFSASFLVVIVIVLVFYERLVFLNTFLPPIAAAISGSSKTQLSL